MIFRRWIAILLCSTPLLGFAKDINLALDWYINPDQAPLLTAKAMGYFADEGLTVNLIEPTSSVMPIKLVANKQADIGLGSLPNYLVAKNQGLPINMIATVINKPLDCISVRANSDIHSMKDLKGKTLAYIGSVNQNINLITMLEYNQISPKEIKLVHTGMNLTQVLADKEADAVLGMMRTVEPVELADKNIQTRLFFPEDNGVPIYDEVILFSNKNLSAQTKKKFLKALDKGAVYLKQHPKESWQLILKTYPRQLQPSLNTANLNQKIFFATLPYFANIPSQYNKQQVQEFEKFMKNKAHSSMQSTCHSPP